MSTLKVNNIEPLSGSAIAITGFNSGIKGVSIYTGSDTWTKTTRETILGVTIKQVLVEVQGGGGGGSRDNSTPAECGGGGGGGYAKKLLS